MHQPQIFLAALGAALALVMTTPAQAAPKSKTTTAKSTKSKAKVKKTKNFDFEGDEIDVDRIRPDGTAIFGRPPSKHTSLIRLRSEFIGHIVKSAEML